MKKRKLIKIEQFQRQVVKEKEEEEAYKTIFNLLHNNSMILLSILYFI
jgi:hypothetical protein